MFVCCLFPPKLLLPLINCRKMSQFLSQFSVLNDSTEIVSCHTSPSSLVVLQHLYRYFKDGLWQLNSLFQDTYDYFIKFIIMQRWLTVHQILVSAGNVCPRLVYSAAFLYLRCFYFFVNVWCYFLWAQYNTFQPAMLNRSPSIRSENKLAPLHPS